MNRFLSVAVLSSAIAFSVSAQAAERAMIILDGSGSMWGQINGKPKLEIARQALRDVLKSASPELELGLMAYGHREKGSCTDIEVLVQPGANTKEAIIHAADQMKFLGKTPISAAVLQAAEELRYTEDKATIILITDGEETCQADPCALGTELKSKGVDFTAHVVGFDLTQQEGEQVACLARNTGGQYLKASNAAELQKAMSTMVSALEEAPAKPAPAQPAPEPEVEEVALPQATVEGPASAGATTVIEIAWAGPGDRDDYITVVEPNAKEGSYEKYVRVGKQSPVKLQLPDALGAHEIRYVAQKSRKTLGKQAIELTAVEASVSVPDSAPAGSKIKVTWTGPNSPDDYITVAEVGAPDSEYLNYVRTNRGSPIELLLPDELGRYEVRYVLSTSKRALASAPIVLEGVTAALKLENSPVPGGKINVAWEGPNNKDDYVTVVPKGAKQDAYLDYARTSQGPKLVLKAPKEAGEYEIRYVIQQSKRVLASIPLTLSDAAASVSAPSSVAAGKTFNVEWTGPGNREDFIELVPANAAADAKPLAATRTSQGSPLPMFAPASAGEYQVRYKMRDTKEVVASTSIIVE